MKQENGYRRNKNQNGEQRKNYFLPVMMFFKKTPDVGSQSGKQHPVCENDSDNQFVAIKKGEKLTQQNNLCDKGDKTQQNNTGLRIF